MPSLLPSPPMKIPMFLFYLRKWLYLEIGFWKRWLELNKVIGVGTNPTWLVSSEEEEVRTKIHTESRPYEDIERRLPSLRQRKRPQKRPTSQFLDLGIPASSTVRNEISVVQATLAVVHFCDTASKHNQHAWYFIRTSGCGRMWEHQCTAYSDPWCCLSVEWV